MNAENDLFKWLTLWGLLISITACSSKPIVVKQEYIDINDSSIPDEYKELIGTDIDYIQSKISVNFPDTIKDSEILNDTLSRFNPIPLDSGILISDYDFTQCIILNSRVEYLKVHIEQQTKIQNAFIEGAYIVEEQCKSSINTLNKSNRDIAKIANDERNRADTWKNVSVVIGIFAAGFLTNSYIGNN